MREKINKLTKDEKILSTLDESLIDKIISLKEENKSYKEISDITGFSVYIIGKVLRKEDIKYGSLDNKLVEDIKRLYNELKSTRKVAKELGVSRCSVRKYVEINKADKLTEDELKINNVKSVLIWRKKAKIKLVEYKGGKCEICGYSKCIEALEFHHKNPEEKDFTISGKSWSFERLKLEVDKCFLLCSNCHREIHFDKCLLETLLKIEKENLIQKDDLIQKDILVDKTICICGETKSKFSKKCRKCSSQEQYDKKPKLEVLLKDVEELGYCGTGRKYGVSDNAIRKWIKSIIKFEENNK